MSRSSYNIFSHGHRSIPEFPQDSREGSHQTHETLDEIIQTIMYGKEFNIASAACSVHKILTQCTSNLHRAIATRDNSLQRTYQSGEGSHIFQSGSMGSMVSGFTVQVIERFRERFAVPFRHLQEAWKVFSIVEHSAGLQSTRVNSFTTFENLYAAVYKKWNDYQKNKETLDFLKKIKSEHRARAFDAVLEKNEIYRKKVDYCYELCKQWEEKYSNSLVTLEDFQTFLTSSKLDMNNLHEMDEELLELYRRSMELLITYAHDIYHKNKSNNGADEAQITGQGEDPRLQELYQVGQDLQKFLEDIQGATSIFEIDRRFKEGTPMSKIVCSKEIKKYYENFYLKEFRRQQP